MRSHSIVGKFYTDRWPTSQARDDNRISMPLKFNFWQTWRCSAASPRTGARANRPLRSCTRPVCGRLYPRGVERDGSLLHIVRRSNLARRRPSQRKRSLAQASCPVRLTARCLEATGAATQPPSAPLSCAPTGLIRGRRRRTGGADRKW